MESEQQRWACASGLLYTRYVLVHTSACHKSSGESASSLFEVIFTPIHPCKVLLYCVSEQLAPVFNLGIWRETLVKIEIISLGSSLDSIIIDWESIEFVSLDLQTQHTLRYMLCESLNNSIHAFQTVCALCDVVSSDRKFIRFQLFPHKYTFDLYSTQNFSIFLFLFALHF